MEKRDNKRIAKIRRQVYDWEQHDYQLDMQERVTAYGPVEAVLNGELWFTKAEIYRRIIADLVKHTDCKTKYASGSCGTDHEPGTDTRTA